MNKNSVFRSILDLKNAELSLLKFCRTNKADNLDDSWWFLKRNFGMLKLDLSSDEEKKLSMIGPYSFLNLPHKKLSYNFDLSLS
jgi:hypothetical protein